SALWCVPAPGLTLTDKIDATRALVASGVDIHAINCVRKHLSAIKGGRLAAAVSARSLTCLLLSDVLGDDPSVIGSGPCLPDPWPRTGANAIARAIPSFPSRVLEFLAREATETPKPLSVSPNVIVIGNHETLRQAAVRAAARAGYAAELVPPAGDDVAA